MDGSSALRILGTVQFAKNDEEIIWQCVKTHGIPCSSHQNSWDLWMFIPLKMVLIGIDPSHMDVMGPAAQLSDPGLSLQDFYRQHVQRNLHGSSQENHNFLVKSPIFPPRNLPFFLFFPGEKRRLFLRPSSRTEAQDPGQRGPGEEPETQRAAGDTCNEKRFPWRIFVIIVMI